VESDVDDRQPRSVSARPSRHADARAAPRRAGIVPRKLLGVPPAKGRAARGATANVRKTTDRNREDGGLHPPQSLRPKASAGRGSAEKARTHRTRAPAARDWSSADELPRRVAHGRYRPARRAAREKLRAAAV